MLFNLTTYVIELIKRLNEEYNGNNVVLFNQDIVLFFYFLEDKIEF